MNVVLYYGAFGVKPNLNTQINQVPKSKPKQSNIFVSRLVNYGKSSRYIWVIWFGIGFGCTQKTQSENPTIILMNKICV
jgi:hypothetical protein